MSHRNNEYVPGVCNIGQAEIRQRKVIGWIALVVSVGLFATLVAVKAAPVWRWTLFVPATVAAVGFLQAAWYFCAKFGLGGVFNFGPSVVHTDTVEQAEFRRQDRRTALRIIGLSVLAGALVAVVAWIVPV